jgi:hypothetical protein
LCSSALASRYRAIPIQDVRLFSVYLVQRTMEYGGEYGSPEEVVLMDRQSLARLIVVGMLAVGANACGDDDDSTTEAGSSVPTSTVSSVAQDDSSTETLAGSQAESPVTTVPLVVTDLAGGATYVTGHIEDFVMDEGTLETDADGAQHSRDGTVTSRMVAGDPRVTATVVATWNSDRWGVYEDGALIQWGTATLTNENGTWECDYTGAYASPVGDSITRWCRGTGDYEGLTLYMWIAGGQPGDVDFGFEGIIVPGDPPPDFTP